MINFVLEKSCKKTRGESKNIPVFQFEKITKEEVDSEAFKLPASKALPIVGPD